MLIKALIYMFKLQKRALSSYITTSYITGRPFINYINTVIILTPSLFIQLSLIKLSTIIKTR